MNIGEKILHALKDVSRKIKKRKPMRSKIVCRCGNVLLDEAIGPGSHSYVIHCVFCGDYVRLRVESDA